MEEWLKELDLEIEICELIDKDGVKDALLLRSILTKPSKEGVPMLLQLIRKNKELQNDKDRTKNERK